jgi:hypothetical protein
MLVQFDQQALKLHRIMSDFSHSAAQHLGQKFAAFHSLHDAAKADNCMTADSLTNIGGKMHAREVASKDHVMSMVKTWDDVSDSITNLADLLLDGGLLVRYVQLAGLLPDDDLEASLIQADLNASDAVAFIEPHLKNALDARGSRFIKQVSHTFDLSQVLTNMWTDASFDPPADEMESIRSAWTRIASAAQELRSSLNSGGEMYLDLVLRTIERHDAIRKRFPAPEKCQASDAVLLQQRSSTDVILVKPDRVMMNCNVETGEKATLQGAFTGTASGLGDFLTTLIE